MSDPANANEAIDLGLFKPSEPPKSETSTSDPHPPSDEQSKTWKSRVATVSLGAKNGAE
jgi:hypothetical protein